LESGNWGWQAAPIYREEKVAYTDANPIKWWDDDLFGYMRAPSKRTSAKTQRDADESRANETPTTDTVTRASPFRVSTLLSIAPANPIDDFGTMSRHEGNPVPHEHQFYHTTLKGLFSLDLAACGRFSYRQKTGFRHLDDVRTEEAKELGLTHLEEEKSYQLAESERLARITALFEGMAHLEGGAKQTLHYTDVSPAFVILAVTKGGNHIFGHVIGATAKGLPELKIDALHEVLTVFADDILSDVYIGWVRGYQDEDRRKLEAALATDGALAEFADRIQILHPRQAFLIFVEDLKKSENSFWLR
ncbi:MAG: type I-B CRISPR-associated protein Cas7/Cst2/DevR, partial [Caldilineaceae bacterium]|nr:type I-B CRISPR-associated protein Cas7/Cst2/DevR [Caldilineaceae bacterium]